MPLRAELTLLNIKVQSRQEIDGERRILKETNSTEGDIDIFIKTAQYCLIQGTNRKLKQNSLNLIGL